MCSHFFYWALVSSRPMNTLTLFSIATPANERIAFVAPLILCHVLSLAICPRDAWLRGYLSGRRPRCLLGAGHATLSDTRWQENRALSPLPTDESSAHDQSPCPSFQPPKQQWSPHNGGRPIKHTQRKYTQPIPVISQALILFNACSYLPLLFSRLQSYECFPWMFLYILWYIRHKPYVKNIIE